MASTYLTNVLFHLMATVKLTGSKYDDTKITMHYTTQNADVTQGDPLSSRIFNIIVDVIV